MAVVTIVACVPTDPIPEPEEILIVEAVLDLGIAEQTILLRSIGGSVAGSGQPARGAAVSILTPEGAELRAEEAEAGFFPSRYVVDLARHGATLLPGATYALRVVTAGGREASGTTTVPLASPVAETSEVQEFSRSRDTLRASWPRVPGARSYYVAVNGTVRFAPGFSRLNYHAFVDTTMSLPGTLEQLDGDPAFTPFDTATVVVAAVDDNFYTYYHANVDPFAGAPPSRLRGAVGVFGALIPIYRRRFAVVP